MNPPIVAGFFCFYFLEQVIFPVDAGRYMRSIPSNGLARSFCTFFQRMRGWDTAISQIKQF